MSDSQKRNIRVAAVQLESRNGFLQGNLDNATPLIKQAAEKGAEIILLPEFLPTGFIFTEKIWDSAEPKYGLTVAWLKKCSKEFGVHLGTSFLEAEGTDFFNTFVLTDPSGNEAGRVRKQTAAGPEARFFKGDRGSHVIETGLGKIGVGICYDNHLAYIPSIMQSESVDLLLMPHSAPTPLFYVKPQEVIDTYIDSLKQLSVMHSSKLGIPTVLANKCGPWQSPMPFAPYQDSSFPGLSSIADSDGSLIERLGNEEGIIVADVVIDPSRKNPKHYKTYGRWASNEGPLYRDAIVIAEAHGKLLYKLNPRRKKRALEVSASV